MRIRNAIAILLPAAIGLAACGGGFGFGSSKPQAAIDPNAYPANYRSQVVTLLTTMLSERAAFNGAMIAPPVLKPVPESQTQHYVVCLQLNGAVRKTKAVIYLSGEPNEFVDATPEECAGAAYQPFPELATAKPAR